MSVIFSQRWTLACVKLSLSKDEASLIAQLVKNPPAMQETPVRFLGQEDPLEKGKATHTPVFWPGEFHGLYSPRHRKVSDGIAKCRTWLSDFHFIIRLWFNINMLESSLFPLAKGWEERPQHSQSRLSSIPAAMLMLAFKDDLVPRALWPQAPGPPSPSPCLGETRRMAQGRLLVWLCWP